MAWCGIGDYKLDILELRLNLLSNRLTLRDSYSQLDRRDMASPLFIANDLAEH